MESIEFATMLPGAILFNDSNRNLTWRAHIHTEGKTLSAFVKLIHPRAIFVECACALLGRSLGLPIPKPIIVLITSEAMPSFNAGQNVLAYGSEDVEYPSFLRSFDSNSEDVFDILSNYSKLLDISLFDEWIKNCDRNLSNMLYGGDDNVYFIDHELAIPKDGKFYRTTSDNQLLQTFFSNSDELDKKRIKDKVNDEILPAYKSLSCDLISEKSSAPQFLDDKDIVEVIQFLTERLNVLGKLFDDQIKIEQREIENI